MRPVAEQFSQRDFDELKRSILLPNGIRLAYIDLGDANGVPVFLLHGFTDSARSWSLIALDLIATAEHQAHMKETIVGAEFISLRWLGHNSHWEDPAKVASVIKRFLERL